MNALIYKLIFLSSLEFATCDELIVLSKIEVLNSKMIANHIPKNERYKALKQDVISQMEIFSKMKPIKI